MSEAEEKVNAAAAPSLDDPVETLAGVGPRLGEKLRLHGFATLSDLVHLIPRRWDDLRQLVPVAQLVEGKRQTVCARVDAVRMVPARRRFLEARFSDTAGTRLLGYWFFQHGGLRAQLEVGAWLLLTGVPKLRRGVFSLVHPELLSVESEDATSGGAGIRVRYPEVEGVPRRTLERIAGQAAASVAKQILDGLPIDVRDKYKFPSQAAALMALHQVSPEAAPEEIVALNLGQSPAQQRLIFDELFFLQLGLALKRSAVEQDSAWPCLASTGALEKFWQQLPFALTRAQRRAIDEIAAELVRPHPMHRLLQGDVGSGKTVLAFAAAELAMGAGLQVAVMAPTELLAEQHVRTLEPWARMCGRRLALLTSSASRPARQAILTALAAGTIDLVVGTHALIEDAVTFHRLGLAVIDEQHRFGVMQRMGLRAKGNGAVPHLLVMTATPIPRTLALTLYGDLDLTTLDEMPVGRVPTTTTVHMAARGRTAAYRQLMQALAEGRQGYVVCPLIDESDTLGVASACTTYEKLKKALPHTAIGLLHGRVIAGDRDETMRRFRSGEIKLLVATTVIEVGVDVARADFMLIEGAERFGLAQLHQLRGRIGRGGGRAECFLVSDAAAGSEAAKRLAVMARTSDGFVIAEEDLKIRGPGEFYGTRQAGMPRLCYADLARDLKVLVQARAEAVALTSRDPALLDPAHQTTRTVLATRWQDRKILSHEAG